MAAAMPPRYCSSEKRLRKVSRRGSLASSTAIFNKRGGNFVVVVPVDEAGIIRRQHFGQRTPAGGDDGQAEGHRLDEIDRLVFTKVKRGKTKQIRLAQSADFFVAGNKAELFHGGGKFGFLVHLLEFLPFFRRHEVTGKN